MRLLSFILVFVLTLVQVACGGFVAIGDFDDGNAKIIVVSGTVTGAQLGNVVVGGGFTQVTIVTLFSSGTSQTFNFCGNSLGQFPMNSFVQVNFNPGAGCNSIVVVIVG